MAIFGWYSLTFILCYLFIYLFFIVCAYMLPGRGAQNIYA